MRDIVCISPHYWYGSWFRKQHFMWRFYKEGYRIAYVEPSFSMVRTPEVSNREYATNRFFSTKVEEIKENLFIVKPTRYLPFYTRPPVSRPNSLYLSFHIQSALKKIGFKDYILWIYRPEFANALKIFNYRKLVFDITDDLAAFNYNNKSGYVYIKNLMEYLAKESDLTLVTAHTLFEKFKRISSNIHLIPNGYDSNSFSESNLMIRPSDMERIPTPIIGFIGTIFSFLDYKLLEYVIRHNQDKSFVFIGNCESHVEKTWLSIAQTYRNVFWLGKKRKEDIPAYISRFDVCINPFKVDQVSRSVSPLKVFEYLAAKKPVVSVEMESLKREEIAPFIYFASSYVDFSEKLNIALREKGDFEKKLNYEKVKAYSWDSLFQKVLQLTRAL